MSDQATIAPVQPRCPECDASIHFGRAPLRGQVTRCADCAVELEVIDTDPLTFALAPEVQEDWGE